MPKVSFASLRMRLLALVLLAVIPALGLILYSVSAQRQLAVAKAEENALRLTHFAVDNQEQLVEGTHQLLTTLAQLPVVREGDAACHALLADLVAQYSFYTALSAIEPDGDVYCSSLQLTQPLNVADRPHIQRAFQTSDFTASEYQIGRMLGRPVLGLAYPVLDESGQVQAVIGAGLDLAWFSQFAAKAQLPAGATFTLMDPHGTILARYPDPEQWIGQPIPEAQLVQTILAQGEGTVEIASMDGVSRLYAFTPLPALKAVEGEGILGKDGSAYVSIGIPTEVAFAEVNQALVRDLAALGLVAGLGLVVAWLGSEVFILGRVKALVNATKRLSAGDLSVRTGLTYGFGELSQLAHAFDEMAQMLQQREGEHEQAGKALRDSEKRFRALIENSSDAVALFSAEGTILYGSPATHRILGYPLEEFVGRNAFELIHPDDHEFVLSRLTEVIQEPEARVNVHAHVLHKNGSWRCLEGIFTNLLAEPAVGAIVNNYRDITERKRTEEAQRFMAEASLLLTNSVDYEITLASVARLAVPHIADWCAVDIVAEDGTLQRLAVAHVDPAKVELAHELQRRFLYDPNAPSGTARALRTGRPEFYPEISDEMLVAAARGNAEILQIIHEIGFTSAMTVPLVARGHTFGAITLVSAESKRHYDSKDLALAEDLARRAAVAIDNANLYRLGQEEITERKQMEQALQKAHDELEARVEQRTAELTGANEQLAALYTLGQIITAPLQLEVVLNVIARSTAQLLETDTGVILLLDEAGETLTIKGAYGVSEHVVKETRDRIGESIAGRVAQTGQPIIANDLPNDPRFYNPAAANEGLLACVSVPLVVGEKIIGTLDVHSRVNRDAFSEAHVYILKMLASQAAIAIENARLYEEVQRVRDELEERVRRRTAELEATNEQLQQEITERKQAEATLHESQDRLAGIVNSAMDAIITVDAEQRIILFNTAAEHMFRCTASRAIGQPLDQFIPERFRSLHQEHIRAFGQTGVTSRAMGTLEAVRGLRADGEEFPVEASISQVETAGQKLYTVILRDITERKRAEEAQHFIAEASLLLANSLEYETALVSVARLAVPHIADWCAVDIVAEDGTLQRLAVAHVDPAKVEWAHELQRRLPYDPNAPSGVAQVLRTGQSAFYPEIPDEMLVASARGNAETLQILREIGFTAAIVVPLVVRKHTFGAITLVSAESKRHYIPKDLALAEDLARRAAVAIDNARLYRLAQAEIAEREQAEATLHESQDRLAGIVNSAMDAIITVDAEQRIILFNTAAEHMFRCTGAEAIGQPLDPFIPERFRRLHREHIRAFSQTGVTSRAMGTLGAVKGLRADGEEFPVEASISQVETAGQKLYTVILRDITERKRAEEELKHTLAELERSNAELQQFAYVASHDMQEPLRMVASYTQLLARRYQGKLDADADDFITYAVDGANRMQRLINDLLTYSRVGTQSKALEPTDSEAVLERVLANLQATAAESDALVTHDALPTVLADETQLVQLFQNLVGNALKFHNAQPPQVHISAERKDQEWLFSVRDNGIGLEPQYAERIFVIFQRLHNKADYPGTGIGLAICKRIVERHGGHIWLESQPGQGTTFYFTLPALERKK